MGLLSLMHDQASQAITSSPLAAFMPMCCAQVQLLHQRGGGGVRLVAADLGQHQTHLTPQGHVLSGDESDFGRLWRSLPTPDLPFGCTRHSTLLMRQEPVVVER